jgi:hypothetical protein
MKMEEGRNYSMEATYIDPEEIMRRVSMKLDSNYIRSWCEEWEIDPIDYALLLERYAEGDDDSGIIDFMCDLARERRVQLSRCRQLVTLDAILKNPLNWEYDRPFEWLPRPG